MVDYKIGEMLRVSADVELKDFFENKTFIKKGTRIWIGTDNLAHYQDGTIQPISETSTVKGYDDRGIIERIFAQLKIDFPLLYEFCTKYVDVISSEDIKESIQYALEELGMC